MQHAQPLDRPTHLAHIVQAIEDLSKFSTKTTAPAPIPHQFVGTVIDNTTCLLHAPANTLDSGGRFATLEDHNWKSLIAAVHRSFLSSIHLATEASLKHFCEERNIMVSSKIDQNLSEALDKIQRASEKNPEISKPLKTIRTLSIQRHPCFDDYLETALKISSLTTDKKTEWRKFFLALSTARNKVSHSDSSLSEHNKHILAEGKLEALISATGGLQFNPTQYKPIVELTLNFFDQLLSAEKI
jgi:hypothetical protein